MMGPKEAGSSGQYFCPSLHNAVTHVPRAVPHRRTPIFHLARESVVYVSLSHKEARAKPPLRRRCRRASRRRAITPHSTRYSARSSCRETVQWCWPASTLRFQPRRSLFVGAESVIRTLVASKELTKRGDVARFPALYLRDTGPKHREDALPQYEEGDSGTEEAVRSVEILL